MRIVLDTNVLMSGIFFAGPPATILVAQEGRRRGDEPDIIATLPEEPGSDSSGRRLIACRGNDLRAAIPTTRLARPPQIIRESEDLVRLSVVPVLLVAVIAVCWTGDPARGGESAEKEAKAMEGHVLAQGELIGTYRR